MAGARGGPYRPEPGWRTRWPLEALKMFGRAPEILAAAPAGFCLGAAVFAALAALPPGPGAIAVHAFSSLPGALVLLWIMARLLAADGYALEAGRGFRAAVDFGRGVFLVATAFLVVGWLLPAGTSPSGPPPGPYELEARLGLRAVLNAVMAGAVVCPLWPVLALALGADAGEAFRAQQAMLLRMPDVAIAIAMITVLGVTLCAALPPLLGAPLALWLCAWIYVAAREIFGGDPVGRPASSSVEGVAR